MNVTFYGQSCLAVELAGKSVLFDPLIRQHERARDVDVPAFCAEFFTGAQGHPDHVTDAVGLENRTGASVIANVGRRPA